MKLYGIGVGPGDPELLTLKAYKVLREADMVVAPRSSKKKESLAWAVIKEIIEERRIKPIVIQPIFPMTRDKEKLENYWREAAAQVLEKGEKCKAIAFITLGDPSLYSTFYKFLDVIQRMTEKIEIEVVPGITSFSACSALAKIPIAEGGETAAIIPRAENTVSNFDTFIFMKPTDIQQIKNLFKEETPRGILGVRIGMGGQLIISGDLDEIPEPEDYFSILIVRRKRN